MTRIRGDPRGGTQVFAGDPAPGWPMHGGNVSDHTVSKKGECGLLDEVKSRDTTNERTLRSLHACSPAPMSFCHVISATLQPRVLDSQTDFYHLSPYLTQTDLQARTLTTATRQYLSWKSRNDLRLRSPHSKQGYSAILRLPKL